MYIFSVRQIFVASHEFFWFRDAMGGRNWQEALLISHPIPRSVVQCVRLSVSFYILSGLLQGFLPGQAQILGVCVGSCVL